MAIGKNKRLTKCVAASGLDSEDCSKTRRGAKASRAEARSADRPPPRRRQQHARPWESAHAGRGDLWPARRLPPTERPSGPRAAATALRPSCGRSARSELTTK